MINCANIFASLFNQKINQKINYNKMKIQSLSSGQSVDSLNIQKRCAFLIFSVALPAQVNVEDPQTDVQNDYQKYQVGRLDFLQSINVSIKMTGSKSTYHVIQNFSLLEIAKVSQNLGFPINVKLKNNQLIVDICLPFTIGRKAIDFSSKNALQLNCKNDSSAELSIFAIDNHIVDSTGILRFEKDTIIANQYTDYKNDNQNLIVAVFENLFEIDVRNINGQNVPYLPEELDTLNDLNGYSTLVWNNESHSNFGNVVPIPMIGVDKLSVLGIANNETMYLVRQINFN